MVVVAERQWQVLATGIWNRRMETNEERERMNSVSGYISQIEYQASFEFAQHHHL